MNLNWSFPDGSNTGSSNWFGIAPNSIFVNCPSAAFDNTYDYHYGYNFFRGKYEFHLGPHTVNKCLEYRIDTIEIKKDE